MPQINNFFTEKSWRSLLSRWGYNLEPAGRVLEKVEPKRRNLLEYQSDVVTDWWHFCVYSGHRRRYFSQGIRPWDPVFSQHVKINLFCKGKRVFGAKSSCRSSKSSLQNSKDETNGRLERKCIYYRSQMLSLMSQTNSLHYLEPQNSIFELFAWWKSVYFVFLDLSCIILRCQHFSFQSHWINFFDFHAICSCINKHKKLPKLPVIC